jgi:hypothetical protein
MPSLKSVSSSFVCSRIVMMAASAAALISGHKKINISIVMRLNSNWRYV